jgi:hypothetical protein
MNTYIGITPHNLVKKMFPFRLWEVNEVIKFDLESL